MKFERFYFIPGTFVQFKGYWCAYFMTMNGQVWKWSGLNNRWVSVPVRVHRGYRTVSIRYAAGRGCGLIHQLVLEVIKKEPKPQGMVCRHLDGNKLNNHPDNLKWGTVQENSDDMIRHGRSTKGCTPFLGRKHSNETKNRLKKVLTGRVFSRSHREKLSVSSLGNKNRLGKTKSYQREDMPFMDEA